MAKRYVTPGDIGAAPASHVGSRDGHPLATTTLAGMMAGADKAEVERVRGRVYDVSRYLSVQAAVNDWMAARRGTLYFPPGEHVVTDTILAEPSGHITEAMEIRGDGATILHGSALAGKPVFHVRNNTDWVWRGLTWNGGITIRGDGTNTGASAETAQLLLEADNSPGALYNFRIVKPRLESGMGHGLHIRGYVFQGVVESSEVLSGGNTTGRGYYLEYAWGRIPAQIRLLEPMSEGFLRGIENTVTTDLVILGGTFLGAWEYGGFLKLSGGLLVGTHFEDNWRSAADINSGDAGVYVENQPNLVGVTSPTTLAGQKQKWGVKTYLSGGSSGTIQGGAATVNAGGGSGSTLAITGVTESNIVRGNNVAVVNLDTQQKASADRGDASVTLTAASEPVQRFATTLTANRTVTLPTSGVYNGLTFRVVRTGQGSGTLAVGGLKTIPADTAAFVEVMHDGTAWRLVGYGAL